MRDIQQQVTDKIIERMQAGHIPWQPLWNNNASFDLPKNETTGKHYNGVNIPLLWIAADEHGFESQEWASYKQWQEKKHQVKHGEKGTMIIYYDFMERIKEDKLEKIPFIKASYVFNKCQLEKYESKPKENASLIERLENVEKYITNTQAKIIHDGGNRAYYSRSRDEIHLPSREAFRDTESLYSVTLHELTHWTGAKERLDRKKGEKFGDNAYAFEELVAELGAAFNCAALSITNEPRDDHSAYIENWLQVLKNDKKAIFSAASEASKAVAYLDALQVNS